MEQVGGIVTMAPCFTLTTGTGRQTQVYLCTQRYAPAVAEEAAEAAAMLDLLMLGLSHCWIRAGISPYSCSSLPYSTAGLLVNMLITSEGKYKYCTALEISKKFKFPVLPFPPTWPEWRLKDSLIATFQARNEQISPQHSYSVFVKTTLRICHK